MCAKLWMAFQGSSNEDAWCISSSKWQRSEKPGEFFSSSLDNWESPFFVLCVCVVAWEAAVWHPSRGLSPSCWVIWKMAPYYISPLFESYSNQASPYLSSNSSMSATFVLCWPYKVVWVRDVTTPPFKMFEGKKNISKDSSFTVLF